MSNASENRVVDVKENHFRFSHEITLGDLCIALGLVVPFSIWLCSVEFRTEANTRTLEKHEVAFGQFTATLQAEAITETRISEDVAAITEQLRQDGVRPNNKRGGYE